MINKMLMLLLVVSSVSCSFMANTNVGFVPSGAAAPSHSLWSEVLKAHVTANGNVDYPAIKADARYDQYLDLLQSVHPDGTWTKNERMAFWINAYNAFTVKLINDHWPVNSIKDISNPWKKSFIKIESAVYSLEDIEHKILRKKFNDPRIHFAINCASYSCPELQNWAFTSNGLNNQLEKVTKGFMNDPKRNVISEDTAQLSKIFSWFKGDFTQSGNLIDFINKYSDVKLQEGAKITFMEYQWNLNK